MTRRRMLTLLVVVAHWIVAVGHLFLAAKVLPAPNNNVSWLAITLITFGHLAVSIALWKLNDKFAGLVSLIFFWLRQVPIFMSTSCMPRPIMFSWWRPAPGLLGSTQVSSSFWRSK
jgi:hypothetical protein